jgi:radical SAM protein with 4Fe4S-binding SPASM domain
MTVEARQRDARADLYRFEHRGMSGVFNPANGRWLLVPSGDELDSSALAGVLHETTIEALESIGAPRLFNVKLSNGCNLSCSYCYDDPTSPARARHMSRETIDRLLEWIDGFASPDAELMFVFHGGEPLLNFDTLRYCVEKHGSPRVEWVVQTNGTLITAERASFFSAFDIRVSLSLDGPQEIHDLNRGGFLATRRAIGHLRAAGVRFSAIATVTADTADHLDEIVAFIAAEGIDSLVVNPALLIGRASPQMRLAERNKADYLRQLWRTALDLHRRGTLMSVRDLTTSITYLFTNTRDYMCKNAVCGAGNLMVSVNVDGDVYPCDYFTDEAPFRCGSVHEPGLIQLKQPGTGIEQESECLKCPFFRACYGLEPCPASRYHLNKAGIRNEIDDWRACEIGRFYKDVLVEATVEAAASNYVNALLSHRYGV